jgi:hypothetical protein
MKITIEEDERDYRNPYCVTYYLRAVNHEHRNDAKLLSAMIEKQAIHIPPNNDWPRICFYQPNKASWHVPSADYEAAKVLGIEVQKVVSDALQRYHEHGCFEQVVEMQTGKFAAIEEEFRKTRVEIRDEVRKLNAEIDKIWFALESAQVARRKEVEEDHDQ